MPCPVSVISIQISFFIMVLSSPDSQVSLGHGFQGIKNEIAQTLLDLGLVSPEGEGFFEKEVG